MSRWRQLRSRLALALGATVVTLGLAELVARFALPRSTWHLLYAVSDDPLLGVELRPSSRFVFDGVETKIPETEVSISSQGFRQPADVAPLPANGVKRLVCIGDSMTFGWGVEQPECWCARLQPLLGPGVETVNLGVPGYNAAQAVRRLERRGPGLSPDVVVYLFNGSDYEPPINHGDPTSTTAFLVDHSALLRWVFLRLKRGDGLADPGSTAGDARRADGGPTDSSDAREQGRGGPPAGDEPDDGGAGEAGPGGPHEGDGGSAGQDGQPEARSGEAQVIAAVERLARLGYEQGFEPVVVFYEDLVDKRRVLDVLDAYGVYYLALGNVMTAGGPAWLIPGDGHPNAVGHQHIAEAIAARLADAGLASGHAPTRPALPPGGGPPTWDGLYRPFHAPPASAGERYAPPLPPDAGQRPPLPHDSVAIPAGDAHLGDNRLPETAPARTVSLPAFSIDRYEVTRGEYLAFARSHGRPPPDLGPDQPGELTRPVSGVDWTDADAFCRAQGKRLPTEAEWERAARGPLGTRYPWGDVWAPGRSATVEPLSGPLQTRADFDRFVAAYSGRPPEPEPGGSHGGDRSAEGVYDLQGNVAEWVADTFNVPPGGRRRSSRAFDRPSVRVVKGVGVAQGDYAAPSAARYPVPENQREVGLGFRCAKGVSPPPIQRESAP